MLTAVFLLPSSDSLPESNHNIQTLSRMARYIYKKTKKTINILFNVSVVCGVEQKGPAAGASERQAGARERRMTPCADLCFHLVAARRQYLRPDSPPLPPSLPIPINIGSTVANLIWIYFKAIKPRQLP